MRPACPLDLLSPSRAQLVGLCMRFGPVDLFGLRGTVDAVAFRGEGRSTPPRRDSMGSFAVWPLNAYFGS